YRAASKSRIPTTGRLCAVFDERPFHEAELAIEPRAHLSVAALRLDEHVERFGDGPTSATQGCVAQVVLATLPSIGSGDAALAHRYAFGMEQVGWRTPSGDLTKKPGVRFPSPLSVRRWRSWRRASSASSRSSAATPSSGRTTS